MKKLLLSVITAGLLFSSTGTLEVDAATKNKDIKYNYASKSVVNAVKKGKIKQLNGIELGKAFSYYENKKKYDVDKNFQKIGLTDIYNEDLAFADFSDKYNNPKITRLLDYVWNEKYNNDISASKIRSLYGKPTYAKKRYNGFKVPSEYVMIYPNATFYFDYYNNVTKLQLVIHHGKSIKNNLSKWKNYNFVKNKTLFRGAASYPIEYYEWVGY